MISIRRNFERNISTLLVATSLFGAASFTPVTAAASEAGNILACINAVKDYTARTVDEFDVRYTGRILGFSTAEWEGVECEASFDEVYSLTVDGTPHVVEGFSGKKSKDAFEKLEADTEEAVSLLESRIQLIKRRLDEAEASLQKPDPNIEEVSAKVYDGISRATGK